MANMTKMPDMPNTLTKTQVENLLDNIAITPGDANTPQVIYSSHGLEIAMTAHQIDRASPPFAILYILDGSEMTKISGSYQEANPGGNRFVVRNLVKHWYEHLAARACEI